MLVVAATRLRPAIFARFSTRCGFCAEGIGKGEPMVRVEGELTLPGGGRLVGRWVHADCSDEIALELEDELR